MNCIDSLYTEAPFYGSRRMTEALKQAGLEVNRKRVQRLMHEMGLRAIYRGPKTSVSNPEHKKFPYLLRGLNIERPNHVWSMDITYLPMKQGFLYLAAIIDWYSRYVLSWELSNSLETDFCLEAVDRAYGVGKPDIFNTDQGVQFTAHAWTSRLEEAGVQVSMDGRGRCHDNIFVERLWRSVKYEDLYPKRYASVMELEAGLTAYFRFYNEVRPHQALDYRTPAEVHEKG